MTGRPDVAERARAWIGTPYRHQASARGSGADCLGLVRGVWREISGSEPEVPPEYSRDWGEAGRTEVLWTAAARHMVELQSREPRVGDVILFRMREGMVAKHLGILVSASDVPAFVHAYARHGVVESCLTRPWRRRIAAIFEFPERSA